MHLQRLPSQHQGGSQCGDDQAVALADVGLHNPAIAAVAASTPEGAVATALHLDATVLDPAAAAAASTVAAGYVDATLQLCFQSTPVVSQSGELHCSAAPVAVAMSPAALEATDCDSVIRMQQLSKLPGYRMQLVRSAFLEQAAQSTSVPSQSPEAVAEAVESCHLETEGDHQMAEAAEAGGLQKARHRQEQAEAAAAPPVVYVVPGPRWNLLQVWIDSYC